MKKILGIGWIVAVMLVIPGLMVWCVESSPFGKYGVAYSGLLVGLLAVSAVFVATKIWP